MSEDLSGFFSNGYAYLELLVEDSWARDLSSQAAAALGEAIGAKVGRVGAIVGEKLGGFVGDQLFTVISNASRIAENAHTFAAEVNDWQSWASVISQMGGGSVGADLISPGGGGSVQINATLDMGGSPSGIDLIVSNAYRIADNTQMFSAEIHDWYSGAAVTTQVGEFSLPSGFQ